MKKLIAILAVAGFFAACNSGSTPAVKTDSTTVKTDSVKVDSTKIVVDSTKKDSTKK
jgi:hypothetical protein